MEFAAELWCFLDADVEERFQDVASVDESEIVPGLFDVVGLEEGGEVLVGDGRVSGFAGLLGLLTVDLAQFGDENSSLLCSVESLMWEDGEVSDLESQPMRTTV